MNPPRVREAGDAALLVEWEASIDPTINARAVAVAHAIRAAGSPGVRDVVPTFRTVAVHFDPLRTTVEAVRGLVVASVDAAVPVAGRRIEVPVAYGGEDGPDLDDVATAHGLTADDVIARHAGVDYRVFMVGFLPGFPYLGLLDAAIATPRLATPRTRVPAGSVGLAGRQTGIYPLASPGGWRIIGRTDAMLFDVQRPSPALLSAGDTVRFVPVPSSALRAARAPAGEPAGGTPAEGPAPRATNAPGGAPAARTATVLDPGLFTTVQDAGRWGHQAAGVPVGGAMDLVSARLANAAVGNALDAATLEATVVGPTVRLEQPAIVSVAGPSVEATLDGVMLRPGAAVPARAGSVLRVGGPLRARAYVAFDGGIAVPPVLGSRSTLALARLGGLGGGALRAADRLPLGGASVAAGGTIGVPALAAIRFGAGGARVRVLPGPQEDWFGPDAFGVLQRARFTISPRSDRMGYRLTGAAPLRRAHEDEMISDATFTGAVQVPPSGEPIVLMADRAVTGGYPQIAIVISADLPRLGQLAPGDWIEFEACDRSEALAALRAQEAGRGGW